MSFKIITIDGPTGVGKSTIARQLAKKINYLYIDTGAMFRCLAWKWGIHGCPESDSFLVKLGEETRIVFEKEKVICDDVDVTKDIRSEKISAFASKISCFPLIREVMKKQQRSMVVKIQKSLISPGTILEGRDIGTVVFPLADAKFYLDASPEIRAKRRFKQLQLGGEDVDFEEILTALRKRDFQDQNRKVAPLKAADDAIIIDTGKISKEEVLRILLEFIHE